MEIKLKTPELIRRLREHLKACNSVSSMQWHKNYGRSLAYLRDKKGITLRSMSDEMKISHTQVWRLEMGMVKWTEEMALKYLKVLE